MQQIWNPPNTWSKPSRTERWNGDCSTCFQSWTKHLDSSRGRGFHPHSGPGGPSTHSTSSSNSRADTSLRAQGKSLPQEKPHARAWTNSSNLEILKKYKVPSVTKMEWGEKSIAQGKLAHSQMYLHWLVCPCTTNGSNTRQVRKGWDTKEKENTTCQSFWMHTVLKEKCMAIKLTFQWKRSQTNKLILHFQKLEKEEQTKVIGSIRKEGNIKINKYNSK
jgi:hypothetical protein